MMEGYRFVKDLTSDVAWEAYGHDLKEVFENSAKALFSVICQIDLIGHEAEKEFVVEAEDAASLMIAWLQELIASVDIDGFFFSGFEVKEISETRLKAVCRGEPATPEKGETVVKAVTYHDYIFRKTEDGYMTKVVVDI